MTGYEPVGDAIAEFHAKGKESLDDAANRKFACTNCYSPTICLCLQDCPGCGAVNFDRDPAWVCDCPPSTDQEN